MKVFYAAPQEIQIILGREERRIRVEMFRGGGINVDKAAERKIAIELATAQAAISREETKLKRVEAELRAAQRRQESPDGSATP